MYDIFIITENSNDGRVNMSNESNVPIILEGNDNDNDARSYNHGLVERNQLSSDSPILPSPNESCILTENTMANVSSNNVNRKFDYGNESYQNEGENAKCS